MKKTAIKKATNLLLSSSSDANISSVAPADKSQQGQSKNLWWVPDDAQVRIILLVYFTSSVSQLYFFI